MKNLIVFNFAMDTNHSIFGHQADLVDNFCQDYSNVFVLTQQVGKYKKHQNLKVIDLNWKPGSNFKNSLNFQFKLLKLLRENKIDIVFSHMTTISSLLGIFFTKFFKIKHYLWYAHASSSFYLRVLIPLLDGIISSTPGSFPFKSKKIRFIGQGIKSGAFKFSVKRDSNYKKFFHVGRLDPSKRIDELISFFLSIAKNKQMFFLIGSPSGNRVSTRYFTSIYSKYRTSSKIKFVGSVNRKELPKLVKNYDCFLHLFQGSLDKSLVEATLMGIPILTVNREYLIEFGSWGKNLNPTLATEHQALLSKKPEDVRIELRKRAKLARANHEFKSWYQKLIYIIS